MWNKVFVSIVCLGFFAFPLAAQQPESDPTRPGNAVASSSLNNANKLESSGLSLDAVFILPRSRSAIINGITVREGQTLQGFVVKSIEHNKVALSQYINGKWQVRELLLNRLSNIKTKVVENAESK